MAEYGDFEKVMQRVIKKDRRYFKRHPDREEYHRAAIHGEFWPMAVDPGTLVKVTNVSGYIVRHALTDDVKSFPGAEDEAAEMKKAYAHLDEDGLKDVIDKIRREVENAETSEGEVL